MKPESSSPPESIDSEDRLRQMTARRGDKVGAKSGDFYLVFSRGICPHDGENTWFSGSRSSRHFAPAMSTEVCVQIPQVFTVVGADPTGKMRALCIFMETSLRLDRVRCFTPRIQPHREDDRTRPETEGISGQQILEIA